MITKVKHIITKGRQHKMTKALQIMTNLPHATTGAPHFIRKAVPII